VACFTSQAVLVASKSAPHEVAFVGRSIYDRLEGSVLITGGLGGLGLVTALMLVEHGARNLIVVS
jgi:NADPH:quinone reductase-like Zn-dependent oxidoreductase